jgi:hypothetical protein
VSPEDWEPSPLIIMIKVEEAVPGEDAGKDALKRQHLISASNASRSNPSTRSGSAELVVQLRPELQIRKDAFKQDFRKFHLRPSASDFE